MADHEIAIAGRPIGSCHPPYFIAEMSANHNGSIENAKRIIERAKRCGADAVKMQTYTPDTITLQSDAEDFKIRGGLWDGRTLHDLYAEAYTPWEWHEGLFDYARELGVVLFSSVFDHSAVDFLEDLGTPAYKIASFEAVDTPLIRYAAATGKPMIISTGMADEAEIEEAIDAARSGGCKDVAILHCVSGYPAPASDYNLRTLSDMRTRFQVPVGLSDHTIDNTTAIASIALGACIVEKHFTLDRAGGGPDDSFSLEPSDLESLCRNGKVAFEALGRDVDYGQRSSEDSNLKFRRSLYFVADLREGEVIGPDDVRSIRPGFGLPPREYDNVVGKPVAKDVSRGTPVRSDYVVQA